jgi:tetratricopeptide (TPR) repeat protein
MKYILNLSLFFLSINFYAQTATDYFNKGMAKSHARATQIIGNEKNTNDTKQAVELYTKAIQLNPNYTEAYFNRGIALVKLLDYSDAVDDFSKTIELNPKYKIAYFYRGCYKIYAKQDKDSACADLQKAFEMGYKKKRVQQYMVRYGCNH